MLPGSLPFADVMAHERRLNDLGRPAALHNDRNELEPRVDGEKLRPVLEAVTPLPRAVLQERLTQLARGRVRVDARRSEDPYPAPVTEQMMRRLEEQLVGVEVGGTLKPIRVAAMSKRDSAATSNFPSARERVTVLPTCERHSKRL